MATETSDYVNQTSGLGTLANLPAELRVQIFKYVLYTKTGPHSAEVFPRAPTSTSVLRVSRHVYAETAPIFYAHQTVFLRCFSDSFIHVRLVPPPVVTLQRIVHLGITFWYTTRNRGDCEESINNADQLLHAARHMYLALYHSIHLKRLDLELLNTRQRKSGPKRLRSSQVRETMRQALTGFSYLRGEVKIEVMGFDTIEYAEMFEEMRTVNKRRQIPVEKCVEDALSDCNSPQWW